MENVNVDGKIDFNIRMQGLHGTAAAILFNPEKFNPDLVNAAQEYLSDLFSEAKSDVNKKRQVA